MRAPDVSTAARSRNATINEPQPTRRMAPQVELCCSSNAGFPKRCVSCANAVGSSSPNAMPARSAAPKSFELAGAGAGVVVVDVGRG
jgi:hypothetical protein